MVATSPSMRSHSWSDVNNVVMKLPLAFELALARLAFVRVGNERHGCDLQRQALPANFGKNLRLVSGKRCRQITHRHRRIEARAEAAGGDLADRFARSRV